MLEMVFALAIVSVLLTALSTEMYMGYRNSTIAGNLSRATFLAQEGMAAIKNIRDNRFFDLNAGIYDVITVNGAWALQTYADNPIEGLQQRRLTITDISATTKEVAVAVIEWHSSQAQILVTLTTHFANWTPTAINWSHPKLGGSFDFTSQNSGSNSHDARAVHVSGNYLYVGNKNSNAKEFIVVSIADTPNLSIIGTLDLDGSPQKMDVNSDYAYIASDSNTQELQIVNVANKNAPVLVGSFNLTNTNSGDDNSDANAIAAWNNYVVLGRAVDPASNFFVFDVGVGAGCSTTNPCLISQLQIHDQERAYDPRDIKISSDGRYAYAVVDHGKLFRINIGNKNSPFIDGAAVSLNAARNASLTITNNRAYIGTSGITGSGADKNEIYIINIANPASTNPYVITSFNIGDNGDDVKNVSFANDKQVLIVLTATVNKDFQTIDVTNDTPVLLGTIDLLDTVKAADWSETYYSEYVVGQVPSAEVQIVVPELLYQ